MSSLSKGCKKVLEVLEEVHELCSAQEIYGLMRKSAREAPGLSTVYRSLEYLVAKGLIQVVDVGDGERLYEMAKPGEHHHHLFCRSCRSSVHLHECPIETFEDGIRDKYGFKIKGHILEIFGTCKTCLEYKEENSVK